MDYSSIHETDDPQAGASPWASSPQQDRNFSRIATDEPPSPESARLGPSVIDSSHPQQEYRQSSIQQQYPQHDAPHDTSNIPYRDQEQAQSQLTANGQSGLHYQQQPDGHQRHMYGQQQIGPRQARPQRPRPKYTMTAKLNGMERAGRKDPMFRFDIHVGIQYQKRCAGNGLS